MINTEMRKNLACKTYYIYNMNIIEGSKNISWP